jgi:acetolactate synthase-1/2/3 large subunit
MNTVEAMVEILKREGVEFLSCFPTTPIIDAAATAGMRPIVCRQERVGVGIADGYTRVTNGKRTGVFAMQYGPGAENAYAGVATAYSDSTPMLILPLGHPTDHADIPPLFSSLESYRSVSKWIERISQPDRLSGAMRRAFSRLRLGRPGPVMLELPADVALQEVDESVMAYRPVPTTRSSADARDVEAAAQVLLQSRSPVIFAGQGVLYAEASTELVELAELLQAPVMTSMLGKGAFPEQHPLSLGTGATVMTGHGLRFLRDADAVLAVGTSLTRHAMSLNIPDGKSIIHATNDERDINKGYNTDHPLVGDARLVLGQLIEAVRDLQGRNGAQDRDTAAQVAATREEWLKEWTPLLNSEESPINPYRVIGEMIRAIPPEDTIMTHDSGSPRDQMLPFYQAPTPRSYIGWGKSHGLGTGLGLIMGAKIAAPEKVCINVMGDAAFGMVGLDFETAVRSKIPIITVVLNNSTMAIETRNMIASHDIYQARDLGGNYADMARAMGGHAERIEDPAEIGPAFRRARRVTEEGAPVLLEFVTSAETRFSLRRAL